MRRVNSTAWIELCSAIASVTLGMWAFRKISDFFLRLLLLGDRRLYHHMLYDYLSIMIHGGWSRRHFLLEFVAPSLLALGFAALALAALRNYLKTGLRGDAIAYDTSR